MPTAKAKPASDTTFIDLPKTAMATKEPITEIGIATDIIRVAPIDLRNRSSTNAANVPPIYIFCSTRFIEEFI